MTSRDEVLRVFSDGGSRGNPGPSAAAYIIYDPNGVELSRGGEYLGVGSNSLAEYRAVELALNDISSTIKNKNGLAEISVECMIDSLMVVEQLNGRHKVANRELWPVNQRINQLKSFFRSVRFTHIPRGSNKVADEHVNKLLDEAS